MVVGPAPAVGPTGEDVAEPRAEPAWEACAAVANPGPDGSRSHVGGRTLPSASTATTPTSPCSRRQTPDGNGRLELFEYIHPDAIESEPTRPNEIGMHRVAFSVDDIDESLEIAARHGCHPLRGVATYGDVYKLTYVRGPSGILVMLAQELNKS